MGFKVNLFADTTLSCQGAQWHIYGIPMLERQIRVFASLGAEKITVIGPPGDEAIHKQFNQADVSWFKSVHPVAYHGADENPEHWRPSQNEAVLLIDAHQLYDQRVLDALIARGPNTHVTDSKTNSVCHLAMVNGVLMINLLQTWQDSASFWEALAATTEETCQPINIREIDPYVVDLRRTIPTYWLPVNSEQDAAQAEVLLIDAAQKGTLDFPARYIHPPLENRLTKWMSYTTITPNHITTITNIIALFGVWLMATGTLFFGLILALVVGILDGVDGKLARVTVRCTKFGDRFEHILDNVYELAWYWAIGWMLSRGGEEMMPIVLSGVITLFYLLDRAATGLFKHRRGIELFDYAPIDRFFRLIGGRRNIYILMLLAGVLGQRPAIGFQSVAVWAVITALFHWGRAIWLLLKQPKQTEKSAAFSGEAAS